jgi:hypothetical protein
MDGVALKPLTVSFSEPGFVSKLNQENQFGPWFTLSDTEKQQIGSPMGPQNPQALNRYSYVLNNPMRWTDPTGHAPPSPCMANQSCWYNKVYDGIQQAVGEVAADILNFGIGLGQTLSGNPPDPYQIAKTGGKHSGLYREYTQKESSKVMKAFNSYEDQITAHYDKISNPEKYISDWNKLDPRHQQGLLRHWQEDITRLHEQASIMRGILSDRGVTIP